MTMCFKTIERCQTQIQSLYMSGTPYRWLTVFRKLDVVMSFASYLDQASSRRGCSTVQRRSVSRFRSSAAILAYISCASLLSLGINLYIPTPFNSFETFVFVEVFVSCAGSRQHVKRLCCVCFALY
jgi:hypothetical protein